MRTAVKHAMGIGSGSWALVQAIILPVYGLWFDRHWYTATFVSMAILPAIAKAKRSL